VPCGDLELEEPDREQIVVSRTFGRDVGDPESVHEALATFATVACERMRQRGLAAGALWVWLDGNPHKGDLFHASRAVPLPFPTRDTRDVLFAVRWLARSIMKPGQRYKRGGVGLADLVRGGQRQADFFSAPDPRRERGMEVLDRINAKFGRGTMGVGTSGWKVGGARPGESRRRNPDAQWRPTLKALSPSYTTKWSDLLRVQ
jgi:DNA polymerase V